MVRRAGAVRVPCGCRVGTMWEQLAVSDVVGE